MARSIMARATVARLNMIYCGMWARVVMARRFIAHVAHGAMARFGVAHGTSLYGISDSVARGLTTRFVMTHCCEWC